MDNKTRYIPSLVMLSAGFVSCVITIVHKYSTKEILLISTGVMVVFLIVGFVIKMIADKYLFVSTLADMEEDQKEGDEETQEESQGDANSGKSEK